MFLQYKSFKNTVEKEIAHNEQFLLSHSIFYPFGELSAIYIEFIMRWYPLRFSVNFIFLTREKEDAGASRSSKN